MPDGSLPSDRQVWLVAEHLRLSELLDRLDEVIGDLEAAPFLKVDAATRLDRYRQNYERRQHQREAIELELQGVYKAPTLHDEMLEQVRKKGWLRT